LRNKTKREMKTYNTNQNNEKKDEDKNNVNMTE